MTRRDFLLQLGIATQLRAQTPAPRIAITMDDFNWQNLASHGARESNAALLAALAKHSNLKIALFACAQYADNEMGRELLAAWSDAGHIIGNHSYSHWDYHSQEVTFEAFRDDLLHGEDVLSKFSGYQKMFRFPFLHEGKTARKRDAMRAFLDKQGYRNGHVTIDTSDWYYNKRLGARLQKTPGISPDPYRAPYLAHIADRAQYYNSIAETVLHKSIPHTILLHYTWLNRLFLDDLLSAFEDQHWSLISAQAAFRDPVFQTNPDYLPAGESLLWAMAKAAHSQAALLRYPGEGAQYEKQKLDRLGL